jgi:D-sedoheptulose 7-phosphate isomerase
MRELIEKRIKEGIETQESLRRMRIPDIEKAAQSIIRSIKAGGTLFVFGNGGSASDSQHIVAELVGRFKAERRPIAAIALTTNTSTLTAIANDYSYDAVFARQIEALGKKGDVALGISTSGNSANVLAAIKKAASLGLVTVALTGCGGGKLKKEAQLSIVVDSDDTPRVQESHALVGHILCELIEKEVCGI